MKISGDQLAEKIGNPVEFLACGDLNTGYSPTAAAVTAPTQKPVPRFDLN